MPDTIIDTLNWPPSALRAIDELRAEIERLSSEQENLRQAVRETLRVSGLLVLADRVMKLHSLVNEK
jgi:hypothetical protein